MKSNPDSLSLKERILFLLEEEPVLTTEQIQKLTGQKLCTVQKALTQLKNKNLIKGERLSMWESFFGG